jgi:hypothetical protein
MDHLVDLDLPGALDLLDKPVNTKPDHLGLRHAVGLSKLAKATINLGGEPDLHGLR